MNRRQHRVVTITLVTLLLSLGACSGLREMAGEFGELNRLQEQLQQQTGQTGLSVNLTNERYLSIGFINSPLAKLSADQKKAKALEVARLAYNDWSKRDELGYIVVFFQTSYDVGPVHYSNSMDNFQFQISELKGDKSSAPPGRTQNFTH